jgi:hypothetical protein
MNLADKFKEKGEWWLPENDNIKCFGELSFDPKTGITLSFFGSLLGSTDIFRSKSNTSIKIIVGKIQSGKCVTLIDCFGHETGSDSMLESTFSASYAILNHSYFLTPETDLFDIISLNLNCNESFFSSFYKSIEEEDFKSNSDLRKFKYEGTKPKHIYKDEKIESSLFFSYSFNRSWNKEEFVFSQRVFINTNLQLTLNFNSSILFAENVKAIFSFFSTFKIFFNYLTIREKDTKESFDIIFSQNRISNERLTKIDLLVRYDEIENQFENMFKWWMTNQDFITNGLSLYLQLLNSTIESFPQRFLSIVFALETLHATLLNKQPFSQEDYNRFKDQKKKFIISEEFKKRFDECMSHFNSMSFSSRLRDLILLNLDLLKDYIYDVDDFILKIKNQRNYFAHNHSESNDLLIQEEHSGYYIDVCKLIFEVCFLSICGINQTNIKNMIKRHFYHNYFRSKMPNRVLKP